MSRQDGFQLLRTPSTEEAEPQSDFLQDHEGSASKVDNLYPEFCYPGGAGDVAFSTTLFTTLYEEEEFREAHYLSGGFSKSASGSENSCEESGALIRPTIYYVLRLFDSIRGFHQGYLDLSGRHPERYYELQSQWNRFLSNFLNLETEVRTCEELNSLGIPNRYFVVFNPDRWRRFQIKWRLPEPTSYSQLLQCTQRVLRDMRRRPVPRFQVLRLTDLPVEVLDKVVGLVSIAQAKMLSSTCHLLNNIGQSYIFRSWLAKLRIPPHVIPFNAEYSTIELSLSAEYSRKDLLKNAEFLMKTPRVSRRIQNLVLADEWWVHRRAHPNENNPFILGMDFYKSAHQIFASVLRCTSKLTTLVLRNLELGPEFTRRISDTPTLHTLDLHLCRIPRMVRKRLVLESLPLLLQITNLHIFMDSGFQETHSQWYALLLCPRIRTLSVVQFGAGTFPALDTSFWNKCQLAVIERLSLDNIDYRDLEELTKWFFVRGGGNIGTDTTSTTTATINGSKTTSPLLLTHFKLHMQWGIPDSDILSLLLALRRAPLEVLVLEGLAEAEFVVIECIASQYPDLSALTLVRRQNPNQHQNKLVVWPHASWEYASCLRGFKGLRHFCWNFLTVYWDATPRLLLTFEEGFSSGSEKTTMVTTMFSEEKNCDPSDDLPYFLDSHWMALPFAAYCPTLHTFSLMDHSVDMECLITRSSRTGRITLTPKYIPVHSFDSWNTQQWNTSSFHWPILLPIMAR
ncbi:hypothetical protein BYT27DRAFT_7336805 [Phlegmacium glaucopus]|nr:hypothetical protein BYT27DRAFT_7336805 [Phlegmacium glaucopus]